LTVLIVAGAAGPEAARVHELARRNRGLDMRVLERGVYRGPHLYSHTPMIRIMLDLEELESWPTARLNGFTEALLERLPGLARHHCSLGRPGGFVERLEQGTWLGHVVEHVAVELQTLVGIEVTRGKTRSVRGREGVYNVMYAYQDEAVGLAAGRLALELVDDLLPRTPPPARQPLRGLEKIDAAPERVTDPFDFQARLEALRRLAARRALGPTTRALAEEARRRHIPVERLNDQSLLRLGWGVNQRRLQASISSQTSHLAVEAAGDKSLTKALLSAAGLPVPRGAVVRSAEAARTEAARLRGPAVVKPLNGNHGRGVSVGLTTPEQIDQAFAEAVKHGRSVIVEEQYVGADYRVLVIGGRIAAAAERRPAEVSGDGVRTVRRLIEALNEDPRRGEGHERVMTRVKIGPAVTSTLEGQGLGLDDVPAAGRVVRLVPTANLSTGGSAIDCTDEIHPENALICERAAQVIGLDIAGIDFLCPDIRRPVSETGGGIVEVNAAPGFRMHLEPSEGRPRDVAGRVLDLLYPRGSRARIPVIAVTGTNGKSTTVRMVAHMLARQGRRVGYTTTSGVYIGDRMIKAADASGPKSARMVLSDPSVEVAVLETARGGIVREGLGFDWCDIGAVLNVTEDHLGLGGVTDLSDLAAIKSVVTESVKRRGHSILNADDPETLRLARHAGGQVIWFTLEPEARMSGALLKHIADGGTAVNLEPVAGRPTLVLRCGERATPLISVREIPAALGGAARFNVANALAAAAMGHAYGLEPAAIADGLRTFVTDFAHNPGRLNIHDGHGFRVILDYAHNPGAMRALGELIEDLRASHGRVIGMVSIPGDRRDQDLREMGALATEIFDQIVFRERPDGRGRLPGEVLKLMAEGAEAAGCPPERITKVLGEPQAVVACLEMARPGDLVVLLPTQVEAVWNQMLAWRPGPRPQEGADADRSPTLHA
jgi:cyanophycin synthetase